MFAARVAVRRDRTGAARRNHQAITLGQAKSGRIIAAAAGIMILVFGSFILDFDRPLQEFGFDSASPTATLCGTSRTGRLAGMMNAG